MLFLKQAHCLLLKIFFFNGYRLETSFYSPKVIYLHGTLLFFDSLNLIYSKSQSKKCLIKKVNVEIMDIVTNNMVNNSNVILITESSNSSAPIKRSFNISNCVTQDSSGKQHERLRNQESNSLDNKNGRFNSGIPRSTHCKSDIDQMDAKYKSNTNKFDNKNTNATTSHSEIQSVCSTSYNLAPFHDYCYSNLINNQPLSDLYLQNHTLHYQFGDTNQFNNGFICRSTATGSHNFNRSGKFV